MAFNGLLLLTIAQVTMCVLSALLSFFVFIPLISCLKNFQSHCLLYASGDWIANQTFSTNPMMTNIVWGSGSVCNFNVFIGILTQILSLAYTIIGSVYLVRNRSSSWRVSLITMIISCLLTLFVFAGALTISVGFKVWCDLLTRAQSGIHTCHHGQNVQFLGPELGISTTHYYTDMQMAQFGAWSVWMSLVVFSVIAVVNVCQHREQEARIREMNQERARLLNLMEKRNDEL